MLVYNEYGRYSDAALFGDDARCSYFTYDGSRAIARSYEVTAIVCENSLGHWHEK